MFSSLDLGQLSKCDVCAAISWWACWTWPQSIWTLRNFSPLRARWFFPKRLIDDIYLEFRPLSRRLGIQHCVPYNTHLILRIVLGGRVPQLSPLCRWGDWGTHSSNNPGYTASQWWSKIWPWSVGHESELESQLQNQVSLELIWRRLRIKVLVIKTFKRFRKQRLMRTYYFTYSVERTKYAETCHW